MPHNTVKVDRTTNFGNPFIVGEDGTAAECVYWLILLHAGWFNVSQKAACCDRQRYYQSVIKLEADAGYPTLRGKNLACWCKPGKPCHADVLLDMANRPALPLGEKHTFDLDTFMARYGIRMVDGRAEKITP